MQNTPALGLASLLHPHLGAKVTIIAGSTHHILTA